MSIHLGCIADDFTGATDLGTMLVRNGLPTTLWLGVPETDATLPSEGASIVALKTRTIPAEEAVGQSLQALRWLERADPKQFFFKYCSTFDSTDRGNIGPVAEALLEALGEDFAIACPAYPSNGRSVYLGYLFVGDVLLSESGMRHHPLTPMTDPSLVRVLGRQTSGKAGLIPFPVVERGSEAIRDEAAKLREQGVRFAIVDAITDRHLADIGAACADHRLITGGSGIAMGLPANFLGPGAALEQSEAAAARPASTGHCAILAGSCSQATLEQVERFAAHGPMLLIDPQKLSDETQRARDALDWAQANLAEGPVLIASSVSPEALERTQRNLGRERAGELVEGAMAEIAKGLVESGVDRMIVAGGETAGAVVQALGVRALSIGPEIDPGVPWCRTLDEPPLYLALKSGNFGGPDFLTRAFDVLK